MTKISHPSHGYAAEQPARHFPKRTGPNIARDASRGKAVHDIAFHDGMTDKQQFAAGIGGMGHPTESGGQPTSHPPSKPPHPKSFKPAALGTGGYSPIDVRNHELGARMRAEADIMHPKFKGKAVPTCKSKC
jgi:hypothetical protein